MEEFIDKYTPWVYAIGAVAGLILSEYTYMTNADEVRLLWVLLLIPVGLIAGFYAAALMLLLLGISTVLAGIALVLFLIGSVIALLNNTVLWTN